MNLQRCRLLELPNELIEAIITHLEAWKDILNAALTCRSLSILTEPHLHRSITVICRERNVYGGRPGHGELVLQRFAQHMRAQDRRLSSLKELSITTHDFEIDHFRQDTFYSLLPELVNLQTLSIRSVYQSFREEQHQDRQSNRNRFYDQFLLEHPHLKNKTPLLPSLRVRKCCHLSPCLCHDHHSSIFLLIFGYLLRTCY